MVWEGCQTFSGSWGYHRDEMTWKSVKQLLHMLVDGVSKGGNLLLNVGPTARGEFDYRAMERLEGHRPVDACPQPLDLRLRPQRLHAAAGLPLHAKWQTLIPAPF